MDGQNFPLWQRGVARVAQYAQLLGAWRALVPENQPRAAGAEALVAAHILRNYDRHGHEVPRARFKEVMETLFDVATKEGRDSRAKRMIRAMGAAGLVELTPHRGRRCGLIRIADSGLEALAALEDALAGTSIRAVIEAGKIWADAVGDHLAAGGHDVLAANLRAWSHRAAARQRGTGWQDYEQEKGTEVRRQLVSDRSLLLLAARLVPAERQEAMATAIALGPDARRHYERALTWAGFLDSSRRDVLAPGYRILERIGQE